MTDDKSEKTVLVVEDELDMRFFLKTLLETSGFRPVIAKNGADGMTKAKEDPPDLILLDVMMPEQGGAIMYRDLKSDAELTKIPVIILSAVSQSTFEHYLKMLALKSADPAPRPDAYVEKPPDPGNLLRIIQQFV
jgi:CheY-like chemotaxis protein